MWKNKDNEKVFVQPTVRWVTRGWYAPARPSRETEVWYYVAHVLASEEAAKQEAVRLQLGSPIRFISREQFLKMVSHEVSQTS